MKIFLDTNVVLDYLTGRKPFAEASAGVIEVCTWKDNRGLVTTLTACNAIYVLSKFVGRDEAELRLGEFLELVGMTGTEPASVRDNIRQPHPDFEDAVQIAEAVRNGADVIVTRDADGFKGSPVRVVSPEELISEIENHYPPLSKPAQ